MSQSASPPAAGPFAERESGLIVPAHLADQPEKPDAVRHARDDGAHDPDGRRRVVFTREERRRFSTFSRDLGRDDLAVVLVCRTTRQVSRRVKDAKSGEFATVMILEEIAGACGEILLREDEGGADPGFGCKCTRIHFLKGA